METINITSLDEVTAIQDGDTLPLVRTASDGSSKAYRIDGKTFKGADGKSAYTIAKAEGYTGTEAEFEAQCSKVGDFNVEFLPDTGEIAITQ